MCFFDTVTSRDHTARGLDHCNAPAGWHAAVHSLPQGQVSRVVHLVLNAIKPNTQRSTNGSSWSDNGNKINYCACGLAQQASTHDKQQQGSCSTGRLISIGDRYWRGLGVCAFELAVPSLVPFWANASNCSVWPAAIWVPLQTNLNMHKNKVRI